MADECLKIARIPLVGTAPLHRRPIDSPNSVRVCRASGAVALQLRMTWRYAHAVLTGDEAREIARRLIAAAEGL